jgi:DNA topoisomerase-1
LAKDDKSAIIVESPTKTRTLQRFLGDEYKLLATSGHVRDLPESGLAVDVAADFRPTYEVIPAKRAALAKIAKGVKGASHVYLACDPDREGEAIAWHVAEVLELDPERCSRIEFNEITERAVRAALDAPRQIDQNRVNAQQARRILDRIVGYQLSPLLQQRLGGWRSKSGGALSAGRVQSAALRIVVERERDRVAFVPQEYWRIIATLRPADRDEPFDSEVVRREGKKLALPDQAEAEKAVAELRQAEYVVAEVTKKEVSERPQPPFRTSTLQRAADAALGFPTAKTTRVAQQLYEGVDLPEGTTGLITYMRTDSTRIADEARAAAVDFVKGAFGEDYLGPGAKGKAAKGAQDAHEAIRPTRINLTPAAAAPFLTPDQLRLYRLIWQRFVASQMAAALYDQTRVDITAGAYGLRTAIKVLRFPGWRAVYGAEAPSDEAQDPSAEKDDGAGGDDAQPAANGNGAAPQNGESREEARQSLPDLAAGDPLLLLDLRSSQHFTQPPPRFTQGTLVAELERYGIGRPSTYAPTIETLRTRRYVEMEGRYLVPTATGIAVYDYLMEYFPHIMDLDFTARMEESLDAVEQGEADWVHVLREFYDDFVGWLHDAENAEPRVLEGETCPDCGGGLVERFSRYGRFASCEKYPECKYSRDLGWRMDDACPVCGEPLEMVLTRDGSMAVKCSSRACDYVREQAVDGEEGAAGEPVEAPKCPECGADMVKRTSKRGPFWGCSRYPECTHIEPIKGARGKRSAAKSGAEAASLPEGEEAPKCPDCGADLVMRSSRFGKFWGCSSYPECRFMRPLKGEARAKRPVVKTGIACPDCGKELTVRTGKRGPFLGCSGYPKCRHTRNLTDEETARFVPPKGDAADTTDQGGADDGG